MRNPCGAAVLAVVVLAGGQLSGQAPAGQNQFPRTQWDNKPDLNGFWQALNTANWDLEDHQAAASPMLLDGARGAIPPGMSVVEGGTIPYQPWALVKRAENRKNSVTGKRDRDTAVDPEVNCFLPGVPRAAYLPHPFQIFQSPNRVWIVYQYSYARREIFMEKHEEAPIDTWMGWSNGRWEGDTLVIDVTGLNDQTWFDRAGNFHSDALHVIERYTPLTGNHLMYEATIEDPKVFTRPWKISMPLYRRLDRNMQLLEFKCAAYVEELFWGEYRKQPSQ